MLHPTSQVPMPPPARPRRGRRRRDLTPRPRRDVGTPPRPCPRLLQQHTHTHKPCPPPPPPPLQLLLLSWPLRLWAACAILLERRLLLRPARACIPPHSAAPLALQHQHLITCSPPSTRWGRTGGVARVLSLWGLTTYSMPRSRSYRCVHRSINITHFLIPTPWGLLQLLLPSLEATQTQREVGIKRSAKMRRRS